MTNHVLLHPIRALKIALRRLTLRADLRDPTIGGEVPPALRAFDVGETLPWKGVSFRVGKIVGGDFPMIILVPHGATRGAKLRGLREMRDVGRAHLKEQQAIRASLEAQAAR